MNQNVTWQKKPTHAKLARDSGAAVSFESNIVLFAGWQLTLESDMIRIDSSSDAIQVVQQSQQSFREITNPLATLIGSNFYLIFGKRLNGISTDIFSLNLNTYTWETIRPVSSSPPLRTYAASCEVADWIYVFGGLSETNTPLNDFWIFSTSTLVWSQVRVNGDLYPAPRYGHVLHTFANQSAILLYGGRNYEIPYTE